MALADAVAALPGGGAFTALWDQVDGDPGAIGDLASTLRQAAAKAEESTQRIGKAAAEVGDAWHGPAAESFAGYLHRFGAAGSSVHAAMDKAATAIGQAGHAVQTAKEQLTSIASRILDRAEQLAHLRDNPDTSDQYGPAVEAAVQDGCAEARPVVDSLVSQLEQTASAVHACVTSGGFAALQPADAGTYLPAKGKPIAWNPIPHGLDPGTTAPASAAPVGGSYGSGTPGGAAPAPAGVVSGVPPTAPPSGDVKSWIEQAEQVLIKAGVPADKISADDINIIIEHESSGNPHAFNGWDSNAAAGTPSKGLMQTIDSTFNAYALPGHTDIWNPVDNIVAGVRYALSRYGSLDSVPGVAAVHSGGAYVGY
jgi:uncharacterized protein YukE